MLAAIKPAAYLGFVVLGALVVSFSFASNPDAASRQSGLTESGNYRPLNDHEGQGRVDNPWTFPRSSQAVYGRPHRFERSLWPSQPVGSQNPTASLRPWGNMAHSVSKQTRRYASQSEPIRQTQSYSYGDLNPFNPLPIRPASYRTVIVSKSIPAFLGASIPVSNLAQNQTSNPRNQVSAWQVNRPW